MPGPRFSGGPNSVEHSSIELDSTTLQPSLVPPVFSNTAANMDSPEFVLWPLAYFPGPSASNMGYLSTEPMLLHQTTLAQSLHPSAVLPHNLQPQLISTTATNNDVGFDGPLINILPNSNHLTRSQMAERAFDPEQEEDDNEELDIEGVKPILCTIPPGASDNSSIEFVLQNYARWLMGLFDPLKVVHNAKQLVLHQFFFSAASRSRVLLIARLMNTLANQQALDEQGLTILGLLRDSVFKNIIGCSLQYPISGETRRQARVSLSNIHELDDQPSHNCSSSILSRLSPPHPPHLFDIMLDPSLDLRHFAAADIILGVITGRATFCRYDIPWSLELSERLEDARIQMSGDLRYAPTSRNFGGGPSLGNGVIDPMLAQKLEDDLHRIRIISSESKDPALTITRMVVQECWREVVNIYFYMALCGASAEDPRVQRSHKKYMRLVGGIRPGRNPDAFLFIPMIVAGLAAIRPKDRRVLISRALGLPEHVNPGTVGNDLIRMLEDIWARTGQERRPAYWDDLSIACHAVTGTYDYVESRGQGFKTRTVPGRRPEKKLAQIEQPLVGSSSATLQSTSGSPSYNILDLDLLELPLLPLADVPLLLDTSPYVIGATPFVQPASAGLLARPNMLFHNPSQRRSTLHLEEDDSEQSDVEGVKSIIYATPHLNDIVDNSSFKFVLQNYQRWFPRVLFDPLRAMRKVTEKVLYQFSLSATSQSRLVLIAQLLGTLSKEWCLDEQGIIMLRLLRDGIFRDIIGCSRSIQSQAKQYSKRTAH
ncbi:hypothetical protein RHS01_05988 [Rhizoctonia solani]|uniref:Uncharacterized protein n=1 Tax=Rhizoctonia solani TaxID=456999 RepID=A0A8H7IC12_9AGAM|nr:hypothetical protein RHS01_05988 [Rhizoctonia solani]